MIDNFLQPAYQSSSRVYRDEESGHDIYLGDIQSALDLDFLSSSSIRTVVTAAKGLDNVSYPNRKIRHIVYPLLDSKAENITALFNRFYDLVEECIAVGSILVHCAAGISRSSTLVLSYLMRKKGWSFKTAIAFVRLKRPTVLPNLGFERQLKKYEELLAKEFIDKQPFNPRIEQRLEVKTSDYRKASSILDNLPRLGIMGKTHFRAKPSHRNKPQVHPMLYKNIQLMRAYRSQKEAGNDTRTKRVIQTKKMNILSRSSQQQESNDKEKAVGQSLDERRMNEVGNLSQLSQLTKIKLTTRHLRRGCHLGQYNGNKSREQIKNSLGGRSGNQCREKPLQ